MRSRVVCDYDSRNTISPPNPELIMAPYTRGIPRDIITFVKLNTVFCYGWAGPDVASLVGGLSGADLATDLGHMTPVQADAVANRIMVMGANSPKPARVKFRNTVATVAQRASTSTFVAYDKLATAITAGWNQSKEARSVNLTAASTFKRTLTAVARMTGNLLYAYPLNQVDYTDWAEELGLESAATINLESESARLFTGSKSTRPGRAAKAGSGTSSAGTFFSTDSEDLATTEGWTILSRERIQFKPTVPAGP